MEKVTLDFSNIGLIQGNDMRFLQDIIPIPDTEFRQRKNYDEYYFSLVGKFCIDLKVLMNISGYFKVEIFVDYVKVSLSD